MQISSVGTEGKVTCLLCGNEFGRITALHLWLRHNITMSRYRQRFPLAEIVPGHSPREEERDVACLLCGRRFYRITSKHLVNAHSITMEQYRLRFPNARIVSKDDRSLTGNLLKDYPK